MPITSISAGPRPVRASCHEDDVAAIMRLLQHTPVKRERPGSRSDAYLDQLIRKPWGSELRVYDDALLDVWMLSLEPGTRTSLHCHPRKDTVLLCLDGVGATRTGPGRWMPVTAGSVVYIEQGAAHRTSATTRLTLVEVETPRDKYDLVRLADDNARLDYEHAGFVRRQLDPLQPAVGGPPAARLRPRCTTGEHEFGLERGYEIEGRPDGLSFAISLDPLEVLRRLISVHRPHELGAIATAHTYLTIRSTSKKRTP
jgi:mannose-6-phosphate isomerase-like protein (cupin superfamily)